MRSPESGRVFWGIVSSLFLLSSVGLTTFFVSTFSTQSLKSSAYTPGSTNIISMSHYVQKFGFFNPTATYGIGGSDFSRLKAMVPFASRAADAFNKSYGTTVEPELIVWWSYAEGVNGRVTFSNCNDRVYSITNCYHPSSWQLGYGIQFSAIGILSKAFNDMHGNPNDSSLVQKVGQNVLNIDKASGVTGCGGYSCTFPKMTIGQIMGGVSTSHQTTNNWWASVLSRDPGINAYINAEALQISWFNRQKAWGWGSYYKNNWQLYSNKLATILKDWISLGGCSAGSSCYGGEVSPTSAPVGSFVDNSGALVTPTQIPTSKPSATPTIIIKTIIVTATPSVTPTPTDTPTPTSVPTPTDVPITPTEEPSPTIIAENMTEASPTPTENPVPSEVALPIPSVTFAPIQAIPTHSVAEIPTSAQQERVAGATLSPLIGFLSFCGILLSLLLVIPITRRKLFLIFHIVNKTSEEKESSGTSVDTSINEQSESKNTNEENTVPQSKEDAK